MDLFVRDKTVTIEDINNQSPTDFRSEWDEWYQKRLRYMTEPYGWMSLNSIDWLSDGKELHLETFPGTWRQDDDSVTYIPDPAHEVVNHGSTLNSSLTITVPGTGDFNLEDFYSGDTRAQLIKRIGSDRQFAVRIRNPHSLGIKQFDGIPYFEPSKDWVMPAWYESAQQVEDTRVEASDDGLTHNETTIGYLHVSIDDTEYTFAVFEAHNDDSAQIRVNPVTGVRQYLNNRANIEPSGHILFKDGTSGSESYGGGRVIGFNIEDPERISYIDFNRSMNLPCAFTAYCTCPLAPAQNILPLPVQAGEKIPTIFSV